MFFRIWKDPVWSKVISASIIGLATLLWIKIGSESFWSTVEFAEKTTPVYNWLILASCALNIYAMAKILIPAQKSGKLPVKEISNLNDAEAKIESWWPRAEGMFPNDVNIDYGALCNDLNISRGIIAQSIANVAYRHCYKPKVTGQNYATYEYDLSRAMGH